MADIEASADLQGASLMVAPGIVSLAVVTDLLGETTITGVSLVRKPYVAPVVIPPSEVGPSRLAGFQPNRLPVTVEPHYSVSPNPPRRKE